MISLIIMLGDRYENCRQKHFLFYSRLKDAVNLPELIVITEIYATKQYHYYFNTPINSDCFLKENADI